MKKNEDETEIESDNENENDEIESKQHRNRLSIDIKTDDVKSKDALNRLRFKKLKKLKKLKNISFEKKSFFFRDANSISSVAYFDRDKRARLFIT
jgi:hypothetical protein